MQHIDLVKESVTLSTENPRVGGSIPPLGTIHKIAQHKLGFFMYGVQGLDENRRCGSKAAAAAQTAERRPQGEDFDSIKIRITNCASNLQRARQREARRGQTGQSLFGLFRPEQPALYQKINLSPFILNQSSLP